MKTRTTAWADAERITDLPAVDEAIRNLLDDQTGDNATALVQVILEAVQPAQGEPVRIPSDVVDAAKAMQKDGYRGPLAWAKKVIDFVADYTAPATPMQGKENAESLPSGEGKVNIPGPNAAYVFSIDASTGYQATTEGVCTPEQYGNALAALHGNRTTLEQSLLDLLGEVSGNFTRHDDLPGDLLQRIDNAIECSGGAA